MKIPTFLTFAALVAVSFPASAGTNLATELAGNVYSTRQACEYAMRQEEKAHYDDPANDMYRNQGNYKRAMSWYYACVEVDRDTWVVLKIR